MSINYYMKILQNEIHSVVLATIDKQGHPHTSYMDVMLADETGVYFLTSKGKDIHKRMSLCDYVSLTGKVGETFFDSKMFSLNGCIKNIGKDRVIELFDKNPYMYNIYPNSDNRDVIDVFWIYEGQCEYTDFSSKPINKQVFTFGKAKIKESGYYITDKCNGCNICLNKCISSCISKGNPYKINQNACLNCGNCYYNCPIHAVNKR